MLSNTLEQQQQSILKSSRKNSVEKIEMMKFLEQLIQDEDQQRYHQSLQQNVSSLGHNISPKSTENTPTPFNNSNISRRSFSRGESAISLGKPQRETTLSNVYDGDNFNNLVINFQYRNSSNSIVLMEDERDRLRDLIKHDKEKVNIPPMFMQKHLEQKQNFSRTDTRRYSLSNVTPEPEEDDKKHSTEDKEDAVFNDLDLDLQNFKAQLSKPETSNDLVRPSSASSSSLKFLQNQKINTLKETVAILQKDVDDKDKKISELLLNGKNLVKENNAKVYKMQKTESLLILQIRKDKALIKKLIKEIAFKDKVNLELAQEMKIYRNNNKNKTDNSNNGNINNTDNTGNNINNTGNNINHPFPSTKSCDKQP